jgi:hypothetical protein
MDSAKNSSQCLTLLSRLLLEPDAIIGSGENVAQIVSLFSPQDFGELWSLATAHHVIALFCFLFVKR